MNKNTENPCKDDRIGFSSYIERGLVDTRQLCTPKCPWLNLVKGLKWVTTCKTIDLGCAYVSAPHLVQLK